MVVHRSEVVSDVNTRMDDVSRGAWRALALASAATILLYVAIMVPLTTVVSTAADLRMGPGTQAWVVSATNLGLAAGLLSSGAIGDDHGRRRIFVVGALLLAGASLLCGLAPNGLVLVLGRVLQGMGGAAVLACAQGIIGQLFPEGYPRARAMGLWAGALGAGVSLGPFVATGGGWRLPYLLVGLAMVMIAGLGLVMLPESRVELSRPVDVWGVLLLGLGVAALMVGLVEGRLGWDSPLVMLLLATGLLLLVAFALYERRTTHPMFDLSLLSSPDFLGATMAAFAAGLGILSLSAVVPIVVEVGLGYGVMVATLVLFAWSGPSSIAAVLARWLPSSLSPRAQLVVGLAGCAVGELLLLLPTSDATVARLLPGLVLAGVANGLLNAALGRQAVASVPPSRTAMGSGANNTARFVGSAIGVSAVVTLVGRATGSGPAGVIASWNVAVLLTTAPLVLGALAVWWGQRGAGRLG
ncbi:major facilitator superfamily MFS_1 [Thermobaculum terrenum ATCC BAA-798]|uniref:Major facilitator superfamily MFS_1 n=1 Tax=Thermobaculum terrenum (strain ATCC BAA-798 / CCMEE 7001 / YNP1) TaxID=525904 RepID=D1CGK4_THET1|nr:MFS transporter [Thermobaculum terrenum]ACZ42875.1 major facilitator superfamily MFS_1 [Thermobaculum terrenum ATCC BAA-798]